MKAWILAFRKIQNKYKTCPWTQDLSFLQSTEVEFSSTRVGMCGYNSKLWYQVGLMNELWENFLLPEFVHVQGGNILTLSLIEWPLFWKWIKYYIWPFMNRKFIWLFSPKWTVKIKLFYTAGPVCTTSPRSMPKKQTPTTYPGFKSIRTWTSFQTSHSHLAPASK